MRSVVSALIQAGVSLEKDKICSKQATQDSSKHVSRRLRA